MFYKKLFCFVLLFSNFNVFAAEKQKIIIDADTANEVDDLFAIVHGLLQPDWQVLGLNAAQWQASHWAVEHSMEASYRLNQVLLSYLDMQGEVVSNRGAETRLFDWGNKSRTSAASQFIVKQANQMEEEKLTVIALGALTNVASAILDDPTIIPKIKLYWLGSRYDFERAVMTNIDFNSVMDIQAVHVILNSNVELHIIPGNVSVQMQIMWDELEEKLEGKSDLCDFLLLRWFNHLDGSRQQRVLWDLALVGALATPEYATETQLQLSPEKGNRTVWMYSDIQEAEILREFYELLFAAVK